MIESHVIDSDLPHVAVVHGWMAENATTSPPTLGKVVLVAVQACGVANFNSVLKPKRHTCYYIQDIFLSIPLALPPEMATTQLHNPLSDLDI
jgi:hypothetical protein